MTEEAIAPLDAYATAKPDEPVFTLQGGDPLAAPLVRLWAFFARRRATAVRIEQTVFSEIIEAAIGNSVAHDDREHDNLLVRATAAEQVSWAMDDYRKGNHGTDKPTEAADTHLTELQRIDLHDLKVRCAQRISNMSSELVEIRERLKAYEFVHDRDDADLSGIGYLADSLRTLSDQIEPRRIFKKD